MDIVRTARFAEILRRNPGRMQRLAQRILHPEESRELTAENAPQRLASAWAAKEALFKSLNQREQGECRFNEWQKKVVDGQYRMVCDVPRKDRVLISISHDGDYTTAFATRIEEP